MKWELSWYSFKLWTLAFLRKIRFCPIEVGSSFPNPMSLACFWQSSPTKGSKMGPPRHSLPPLENSPDSSKL